MHTSYREGMTGSIGPRPSPHPIRPKKGAISYAFGMALAKLFAEVLFNTPRLLHLGVYAANYELAVAAGNSRPDLIGLTTAGEWIVFEAKGRSNGIDENALMAAKEQTQQLLSIDRSGSDLQNRQSSLFLRHRSKIRYGRP